MRVVEMVGGYEGGEDGWQGVVKVAEMVDNCEGGEHGWRL